MKICFPVRKNDGLQSRLFNHFGLAPLLLIVDSESKEVVEADNRNFRGMPGPERFRTLLEMHQIDALMTCEIGIGAFRNLQALGVRILQGVDGTIETNLQYLQENNQQEIETENIDMIGHGQERGFGKGTGRGLNCRAGGQGGGMGQGRNQGAGRGLGRGNGCGTGQGRGMGCSTGRGFGRGMGRGAGLQQTDL